MRTLAQKRQAAEEYFFGLTTSASQSSKSSMPYANQDFQSSYSRGKSLGGLNRTEGIVRRNALMAQERWDFKIRHVIDREVVRKECSPLMQVAGIIVDLSSDRANDDRRGQVKLLRRGQVEAQQEDISLAFCAVSNSSKDSSDESGKQSDELLRPTSSMLANNLEKANSLEISLVKSPKKSRGGKRVNSSKCHSMTTRNLKVVTTMPVHEEVRNDKEVEIRTWNLEEEMTKVVEK
ncbi:hypothetical protein QYF36_005764 [Acer negundo]|nr:hypothetical protein QYF36_005764 [Acer negundo]